MSRQELHTDNVKIEQKAEIADTAVRDRAPEVIVADNMPATDYLDELAFNEEPLTIRLEPTAEKNAASHLPVWVNGKGCELFQGGRWHEHGYVPIGMPFVTKRKYVEVMIRAKHDALHTEVREPDSERPHNIIKRFTSAVQSLSIIEDRNPRGAAWLTELRRRNF